MRRIIEIEGLRGYLAFIVVLTHLKAETQFDLGASQWLLRYFFSGGQAVDVFIIISGFVIFYLLDARRESYLVFIVRRFFRLWPLLIVLYLVGVMNFTYTYATLDPVEYTTVTMHEEGFDHEEARIYFIRFTQEWEYLWAHTLLHGTLMHGVVPRYFLKNAPGAYIYPGWSVSLEWQFYLIAPFAFWAVRRWCFTRPLLLSLAVYLIFMAGRFWPYVSYGAFLPMHVEFFYIGCFSYFLYKALVKAPPRLLLFPYALPLALMIQAMVSGTAITPYLVWVVFFCLIVDRAASSDERRASALAWIFNNPVAQYLGKISYSIYLSHIFGIALALMTLSGFSWEVNASTSYFFAALVLTTAYTLIISVVCYHSIEVRGIKIGHELANKLAESKWVATK